jgi:hypothetical protein
LQDAQRSGSRSGLQVSQAAAVFGLSSADMTARE